MLEIRATRKRLASACGLVLVLQFGVTAATAAEQAGPKIVYGPDNRMETFNLKGAQATNAAATAALVDAADIKDNHDGTSTLKGPTLRQSESLCPGQRFAQQPTPAFCSGVLLAANVVATAGHCVYDQTDLAGTRFVFDFAMIDASKARTRLPNGNIYRGKRLLSRQLTDGNDYAVVQLDRAVTGRSPAKLQRSGKVASGASLYVIGHPSGLPSKFAGGARVQGNDEPFYFQANLDTFAGNSGSPVFSKATNKVVGLLVRGAPDYTWTSAGCSVVNVAPNDEGEEEVTRATVFAPFVPVR